MNYIDDLDNYKLDPTSKYFVSRFFAEIFTEAYDLHYDIMDFTKEFMKSNFCKQYMDTIYSVWQYQIASVSMEVIEDEIHPIKSDNKYIARDDCYTLGYLYKQLYIETKIPSTKLVDMLPFNDLYCYIIGHPDYEFSDMVEDLTEQLQTKGKIEVDGDLPFER